MGGETVGYPTSFHQSYQAELAVRDGVADVIQQQASLPESHVDCNLEDAVVASSSSLCPLEPRWEFGGNGTSAFLSEYLLNCKSCVLHLLLDYNSHNSSFSIMVWRGWREFWNQQHGKQYLFCCLQEECCFMLGVRMQSSSTKKAVLLLAESS